VNLTFKNGVMKKNKTGEKISNVNLEDGPIFYRSKLAYIFASQFSNGKVLELGTGTGYGIDYLAKNADLLLTIDKDTVNYRKITGDLKNVFFLKLKVPDLYGIPSESFDLIVCLQFIEHIEDDIKLMQEIFRVLKKNGKCIVSTPNKNMTISRNPYHYREYNPTELRNLVSKFSPKEIKILGVNGNEKVNTYYQLNKYSVKKIERFDIFLFRKWLPSFVLKLPFEILNRYNRLKLYKKNSLIVNKINVNDFTISDDLDHAFDLMLEFTK
jgi:SAM-dependent methyltransferase